jgi:hypothetical protein
MVHTLRNSQLLRNPIGIEGGHALHAGEDPRVLGRTLTTHPQHSLTTGVQACRGCD